MQNLKIKLLPISGNLLSNWQSKKLKRLKNDLSLLFILLPDGNSQTFLSF